MKARHGHHLPEPGTLAQNLGDYQGTQDRYEQSLTIFVALGKPREADEVRERMRELARRRGGSPG